MPKAIQLTETGDAENLTVIEQAIPAPGPGEVQIRNHAIGINFIDIYIRRGLYAADLPIILGKEAAGEVIAIGQGVTSHTVGDRVAALVDDGGYAEVTNAQADRTAILPGGVSYEDAAAILLKGLTAAMLLRDVYPLKSGDKAIITAAAGGVGGILCQWARIIGGEVIAIVGSAEKLEIARANKADHIIIREQTNDLTAAIRDITDGDGADVAYDSLGADTFISILDALRPRATMVTYGNATGPVPPIAPLELAKRGSLTLIRPTLFDYATPERFTKMAADLFTAVTDGGLRPKIHKQYQLDDAAKAHQFLESGQSQGAVILRP